MSGPIEAIAGVVVTGVGIITGQGWLVAAGINLTAGGIERTLGGAGLGNRQRGLMQNVTSSVAAVPVVYGEAKVGGLIADVETYGTNNNMLALVLALVMASENGAGIESVEEIYFDQKLAIDAPPFGGEPQTTGVQSSWIISGDNHVSYGVHAGADTQVVDSVLAAQLAGWGTSEIGLGIAYVALYLKYGEKAFATGVPNVTALIKGQKVYDPRTSSWAWSDNPALCVLDYLTSKRYGLGAAYAARDGGTRDEIDEASFIACANYCEGAGGFTCNGAVDTSQPLQKNLQDLLCSCRGQLVYSGGQFSLQINQVAIATTFELTEDNIVGDWDFVRAGTDGAPNRVTCNFVDAAAGWQADSVMWPEAGQTDSMLDDDNGFENILSIDLPFVTDYYIAQQIGMVTLRERRNDLTVAVTAMESALVLSVGDVVKLTHSTPGWIQKLFRVQSIGMTQDALVRLGLVEYTDAAYSIDAQNTRDTMPGTSLPDVFTVDVPASVAVTSDSSTALLTQDGQYVPQLKLALTPSVCPFLKRNNVQFKLHSAAAWNAAPAMDAADTTLFIGPVTNGAVYDVRVNAENSVGSVSDWVTVSAVTAGTNAGTHRVATFYAASGSTPTATGTGDLWFQTDTGQWFIWTGSAWVGTAGTVISSTEPATKFLGLVWVDTSSTPNTEKRWSGSAWVAMGTLNQNLDEVPDGTTNVSFKATLQTQLGQRSPSANLLYNADMRSTDFWSGGVTLPSVGVIQLSMPANGGGSYAYYVSNQTDERGNMRYFPVTPGDVVYISADAQLASGTAHAADVQAWLYDSAFGNATILAQFPSTPTGTWATMKGTATVPATIGASAVPAYLRFDVQAAVPAGAGAWACNFRRPALLVNHMTVGVSGGMPANDTSNVNGMASTDVSDGAGRAKGAINSAGSALQSGVGADDGVAIRPISKGHLEVTGLSDGDSVTFPTTFQNPPVSVLEGGLTWHNFGNTNDIGREVYAENVTASACDIRAKLVQKGVLTARTESTWTPSTDLTAQGNSAAVTTNNAPASGNQYNVNYDVTLTPADIPDTASMVVAVDTNDGGGWYERATKSYFASGAGSSWTGEQISVNVSGLTSTSQIRLRIKSLSGSGGTNPTADVNPTNVTYNTSTDTSVSATPSGYPVTLKAWEAD